MAKKQYLSDEKKHNISELYQAGKISVGSIAKRLGVSLRSVHNYKNYRGETDFDILSKTGDKAIFSSNIETDRESANSFENHHQEPETNESIGDYVDDYIETDVFSDNNVEPEGNTIGTLGKAVLIMGVITLFLLGIIKYLAHRPLNNDENPSQPYLDNRKFNF